MRVSPENTSIWISRLSKGDGPHQWGQASFKSNEGSSYRTKRQMKSDLSLSFIKLWHSSFPETLGLLVLSLWTPRLTSVGAPFLSPTPGSQAFRLRLGVTPLAPLVLRSLDSDRIMPPVFLVLQLASGKLWDFLASVTAWVNSYNKSPYI